MQTFKDKNGKDWPIEIDLATITRVKADTGVQLIDLVLGKGGEHLADDYEAVGKLLWSVNEPEARRRGVTPEDFPQLFDGTAIDACMTALSEAVRDFLPSGRRELAGKVILKGREVMTKATAAAAAKVDLLDVDQIISQMTGSPTAMPSNAGATNSEASPALIPGT